MANFTQCLVEYNKLVEQVENLITVYEQTLQAIENACVTALKEGYLFAGIVITGVPLGAQRIVQQKRNSCVCVKDTVKLSWGNTTQYNNVMIPWEAEEGYYQAILNNGVRKSFARG